MATKIPFMCWGQWLRIAFGILHIPGTSDRYVHGPADRAGCRLSSLLLVPQMWSVPCSTNNTETGRSRQHGVCSLRQKTCVHCRKRGHAGICVDDPVYELLAKVLGKGNAKYCRKCHQLVEKNGGCNHMTCRCGHQWCWLCGRDYRACGCLLF